MAHSLSILGKRKLWFQVIISPHFCHFCREDSSKVHSLLSRLSQPSPRWNICSAVDSRQNLSAPIFMARQAWQTARTPAAEHKSHEHDAGYGWHCMAWGIQTGRCAGQNFKVALDSQPLCIFLHNLLPWSVGWTMNMMNFILVVG